MDLASIVTKTDPIPLKDVKGDWLERISKGYYCGHNSIHEALKKDMFSTIIGERVHKVSRWALNTVDPELRNKDNLLKAELRAQ